MKRRRFLAASAKLALGARAAGLLGGLPAALLAAQPGQALKAGQLERLALMARALLPHDFIDDSHYLGVAGALDRQAAEHGELQAQLSAGLARLDALAGGDWLTASVDSKLRSLETVQDEQFFRAVLNTAIEVLYRDPVIYKRLGYEGSSFEFGGYLHRGFDDIDWLPAPASDRQ